MDYIKIPWGSPTKNERSILPKKMSEGSSKTWSNPNNHAIVPHKMSELPPPHRWLVADFVKKHRQRKPYHLSFLVGSCEDCMNFLVTRNVIQV